MLRRGTTVERLYTNSCFFRRQVLSKDRLYQETAQKRESFSEGRFYQKIAVNAGSNSSIHGVSKKEHFPWLEGKPC
jgi:hypothetical protein